MFHFLCTLCLRRWAANKRLVVYHKLLYRTKTNMLCALQILFSLLRIISSHTNNMNLKNRFDNLCKKFRTNRLNYQAQRIVTELAFSKMRVIWCVLVCSTRSFLYEFCTNLPLHIKWKSIRTVLLPLSLLAAFKDCLELHSEFYCKSFH